MVVSFFISGPAVERARRAGGAEGCKAVTGSTEGQRRAARRNPAPRNFPPAATAGFSH